VPAREGRAWIVFFDGSGITALLWFACRCRSLPSLLRSLLSCWRLSMADAFKVVRDFEAALCNYTGAPYAVTVNSCTMALLLAVAWHLKDLRLHVGSSYEAKQNGLELSRGLPVIQIPKRTYVSVPQSIIHAGGRPTFRDEEWVGYYDLRPLHVFDCARYFTSGMWCFPPQGVGRPATPNSGYMMCLSFHWCKTLGIQPRRRDPARFTRGRRMAAPRPLRRPHRRRGAEGRPLRACSAGTAT
jgi:hypothetical protein